MFPWTTCSPFKVRCIIIVIVIITPIGSCIIIIIVITVECKSATFLIFNNFSFLARTEIHGPASGPGPTGFDLWIPGPNKRSKTIPCEVANKKRQNFISLFRYSNKANLNFLKQKKSKILKNFTDDKIMEHVFNHDWFQMIQSSLIFNPNYLNQIQKAKLNRFSKFVVFYF